MSSSAGITYNRDSFGEDTQGAQRPLQNVFRREGDVIRHFQGSELLDATAGSGQETRHVDPIIPLQRGGQARVTPDLVASSVFKLASQAARRRRKDVPGLWSWGHTCFVRKQVLQKPTDE